MLTVGSVPRTVISTMAVPEAVLAAADVHSQDDHLVVPPL